MVIKQIAMSENKKKCRASTRRRGHGQDFFPCQIYCILLGHDNNTDLSYYETRILAITAVRHTLLRLLFAHHTDVWRELL